MIKVADAYGVKCDVPNPTKEIRGELPIWYHCGFKAGRSTANSVASRCLRDRHGVVSTAQCAKVAGRITLEGGEHRPNPNCMCYECDADRRVRGCANPHRCATAAAKAVAKIWQKWDPSRRGNRDGLTLTRGRKQRNESARLDKQRVLFDPSVTLDKPVASVFRVFTKQNHDSRHVGLRPLRRFVVPEEEVEVYTDGSCAQDGQGDARAGSGVWFQHNDERNEGVRVPFDDRLFDEQSNQAAEIYAVTLAESKVPRSHQCMSLVTQSM
ncbi:hypothetical protein OH77DRAFT_1465574 [Trametes cingulata]|nr:hypothetical protein OH77DRAFT_1465574 [Trametes cingulata]